MNIKKLFATLAGVSLFAQTVVPFGALAATYSQELQDAYNWAYGKSITTMSPIDNANMYGAITRAELAKMLANWAKDKGQTPDTSKACTFTDTASVKGDLATAIVEACQLGLMGQGITAFRPYDTISRAEFGTALSRALWGDKYEGGTPYYAKHLDALKAAGIMTQIANAESTKEVRGYVMLMLMRSEGSEAAVDCNDAMIKAACVLDSSECPAACKTTEEETSEDVAPKSGDLAVTATPASGRKAILEVASDLDTLTFKTSESVDITKVVLERYGYSKRTDVDQVWLEDENGNIISSQTSVNSRDQVSLSIKKDYRTVDGTFNATIVVKLTGNVTTGGTIGFKVVDAESTAKNLNLDNYTPYEYDMVGYTAAKDVTIDSKGSDKSYNYEDGEMYEVAKLKVKASTTAIDVNGFTFTNNGASRTLDLKKFLDKVEVTVDGNAVKGVEYSINKAGELTISFNSVEVAAKSNSVFAVNISLADFDEYGSHVKLELAQPEHFKATEKKTNARITLTGGNMPSSYPEYTFAGSKIKLTNNKLGNLEYAQWASDVVVAEGTISVAEGVEKVATSNRFVVTGTYLSGSSAVTGKVIEQMRLLIAGEEYTADPVQTNNVAVFTFPQNIEIEKSGKFQVVVDLNTDNDAPAGTKITFEGTFDDLVFSGAEYTDSNRSVVDLKEVSGVISFAKQLTVQAGKSSFTNSLTKTAEFLDNEVETKTVFDGTYTAKKNDVNLLDFVVSGATATGVTTTFYLYIDGKEVADVRLSGDGAIATGSDSISKVKVAAGESIKVRIDAEVNAKKVLSASFTWDLKKYDIVINWEDDNNNPIDTKAVKTVQMKIVGSETIKITDASAARAKDVALKGTEATLAQFTVKPSKGDSARFEDFVFGGTYSGSTPYEADDLVVILWDPEKGTELECYGTGTDEIMCDVYEDIDASGTTVTIKLNDANKAEWDVVLSVSKLNWENASKTFEKKFLDAVIRVESQKWGEATTTFKLSLQLSDDVEESDITEIKFYDEAGNVITGATASTYPSSESVTIPNGTVATLVHKVTYKIGATTGEITKLAAEDYFKNIPVEGTSDKDDLMVYRNK